MLASVQGDREAADEEVVGRRLPHIRDGDAVEGDPRSLGRAVDFVGNADDDGPNHAGVRE